MFMNGFLMTGTRMIAMDDIETIDLWKTDESAEIKTTETRIRLDEDESLVIRRWAELSMQSAMADAQCMLIHLRCDLQEQILRAAKLNKTTARRSVVAKKKPAQVARPSHVVDIDLWMSSSKLG